VTKPVANSATGSRTARQILGQAGEDAALEYLKQSGLIPVERNFRCKGGEIDIVMRDNAVLVFVEVRKRADNRHGGAAASITVAKQARLVLAAQIYLQRYKNPPACRFDVVAIDGAAVSWLKNAIEA
jgi:putative endonuclease